MKKFFLIKKWFFTAGIISFFLYFLPLLAWSGESKSIDRSAELFFSRCASCHTIGEGDLTGPDLESSTQWSSDDLKEAVEEMQENVGDLSQKEIIQLVHFLKDINVKSRIKQQKHKIESKLQKSLAKTSFKKEEAGSVDKAAELFLYRCAGCHTVGEGDLTGPDLKSTAQWSDVDLKKSVKRMEKNVGEMSDKEIDQLVHFLKDINVQKRIDQQKSKAEEKLREDLPKASFEQGQKIFRGNKALINGGPACIACHYYVREGGSLGPDLTDIHKKSSGIILQSSIKKASYKVMRPIYEKHKITQEEALHLSEYLSHPEKVNKRLVPTANSVKFLAVIGFICSFGLLWVVNKKRKGPTREKLVRKYKSH